MNKFFTSDHHFYHKNVIKFCNRPFKTIEEMHEILIDNWNNVVNDNDEIYYLGDFSFGTPKQTRELLLKLKGKKYLIVGSHDRQTMECKDLFVKTNYMWRVDIDKKTSITLCHYCMRRWTKSHYNSWHLYGHSHGELNPIGKSWDVGVDVKENNYTPLSLYQVIEIMRKRPDNPDYTEFKKRR